MADNDLYLRSDVDKGETSPDKDLRLRSDADKPPAVAPVAIIIMQPLRRPVDRYP